MQIFAEDLQSFNYFRIYQDGTQIANGSFFGSAMGDGTAPLQIGRRGSSNSFFNGQLDDVRLYNRGITLAEIETLANCTGPGKYYYNFAGDVMQWCQALNAPVNMATPASGTGGCTPEGALRYQTDRYQFCDGNGWVGIGK